MRLKILLIILVSILFATPVSSTVLFYEDFEDALDFNTRWTMGLDHGTHELSTEQVRSGSKSYKFSLTHYDDGDYKEGMVAEGFNNGDFHFTIGNEYWIGLSLFLGDNYPTANGYMIHTQLHGDPDEFPTCDPTEPWRNPPLTVGSTESGKWMYSNLWDSAQCTYDSEYEGTYWSTQESFLTGQWNDFVVNVKWSYGVSGFLKIWKNGVLVIDRTGPNCFHDNEGPYLWIGIYSYHLEQDQTIIVYYDELRIGDSESSYAEVVPGGESLLPAVVAISTVSDITPTTAIAHGSISDVGSANATKRGVCWNTIGNPTVASSKTEESGNFGIGAFSANMTGLNPGQHYYVKMYALNTAGYGYSSQSDFYAQSTGTLISQSGWSLHYVDSEELVAESNNATNAFDGNETSFWHTEFNETSPPCPHEIQINLGASYDIDGFRYLPRQDGQQNGRIAQYEFYISTNGSDWGNATASDTFVNDILEKEVNFTPVTGQYVRLLALSEVNGGNWTSMAELNVLGVPVGSGHNDPSVIHGMTLHGCSIK